ncbi:hypothetical protein BO99DRAFT_277 [Aspergillus violaceofuscus CBS 115571]|uniref:Uncharacterized protein n=1 Tax=Aspergillus violaceofuscus (strain CBS 115571) TaxID=1450538 RepID=A0A2V5IWI7_ASPV1|nr:hypothetical protein BO99DRAFT_277 [Aspergillus violaceofuscus CBS 115571]
MAVGTTELCVYMLCIEPSLANARELSSRRIILSGGYVNGSHEKDKLGTVPSLARETVLYTQELTCGLFTRYMLQSGGSSYEDHHHRGVRRYRGQNIFPVEVFSKSCEAQRKENGGCTSRRKCRGRIVVEDHQQHRRDQG